MSNYIRYAKVEDASSLSRVYSNSFNKAFEGIIPESILQEKFTFERIQERMIKELKEDVVKNIIMFKDEEPIGMLSYTKAEDEDLGDSCADIWRIYLEPECWNQKLGVELMNWVLKELKEKGYEKAILWVIEDNKRARKFYDNLGFKYDGTNRIIKQGKEIKDLRYMKLLGGNVND